MDATLEFPSFDECLPGLDQFILELVSQYNAGKIKSWDELEESVSIFFTPERMVEVETVVPHWRKMASYANGITLVHVICVFMGLYMLPEFLNMTKEQQQLMKWIILFHDVEKEPQQGKKDTMHAFRSGALAANILTSLGFPGTEKYPDLIRLWSEKTSQAFIADNDDAAPTPDNRKLPEILAGIEQLYGEDTPATLIIKTVLLHISLHVDEMYPTPAPLTNDEAKRYFNSSLFPLLRVMMLSDNEGWSMFDRATRARQRSDTLKAFDEVERLIS
jgi:hypothetical protein